MTALHVLAGVAALLWGVVIGRLIGDELVLRRNHRRIRRRR